jgi:ADP-ribose pyrophosphatase YjhB (NUDIX family)
MSTQRIDYYDSPEAPRANSLVPAVNVVVVNHAGAILLIRRTDNGNWALPGGAIDLGESVARAAVRETFEESGGSWLGAGRGGGQAAAGEGVRRSGLRRPPRRIGDLVASERSGLRVRGEGEARDRSIPRI